MDAVSIIKEKISKAALNIGKSAEDVMLLAVSKTVLPEKMKEVMAQGITLFGENYVQELLTKYDLLHSSGARFHFIGHLQTNKVKYIIDKVELIHSVDSEKLAREISKQAQKKAMTADVLIEVNVGREESKSGVLPEKLFSLAEIIWSLPCIRLRGLMAIPPFDADEEETTGYFKEMNQLFVDIKNKKTDNNDICFLSLGMSGDYEQAISCGSNIVRIGTAIFGARDYTLKNS